MNSRLQDSPIAIIGMAGLFPKASNLTEYWENIFRKEDCITDIPVSRWKLEDYYDADPQAPDKTYSRKGGFLPDIPFDPMEFGMPPNIMEVTDSSQLLSLIVTRELFKDAGYGVGQRDFDRSRTGVILGVVGGQKLMTPLTSRLQSPVWEEVLKKSGLSEQEITPIVETIKKAYIKWEENSFPGMLSNVIAGRVANRFDLGGLNCVIDAACAGSLAAIKMSISELLDHRVDMMISGGVDTDNSPSMYLCFSKTPAFTKEDKCQPFDKNSKGIMIGEAIGMVLLKRLADAERDQDHIYAVIRGIGCSSDGKAGSIYAPCSSGQSTALKRAYEDAGFAPESVGLVEAHGTGTVAGDLTEFGGLRKAFHSDDAPKQQIALGTVKSQIAHTKGAAGSAGLIKAALALHHKVLPPTLNVETPHPDLDIENTAFYLNTETRPWISGESQVPRRAGVSAFGFGGSNYHVVLEEYQSEHAEPYMLHREDASVLLHAATPESLLKLCHEWNQKIQAEDGAAHLEAAISHSEAPKIPESEARVGFSCNNLEEAQAKIELVIQRLNKDLQKEQWNVKGIHYRKQGIASDAKVVALFSGQGSQYVNMGKELAMNFPEMRTAFAQMDDLFLGEGEMPLSQQVFPRPVFDSESEKEQTASLQLTQHAQPAIGSLSVGLFKVLQQAGFHADFTAGHSFGELTALWAAGVLSDKDYSFLALKRGQAMKAPETPDFDAGAMVAVMTQPEKIQETLGAYPKVLLANWNSSKQIVLAGPTADIVSIQKDLKKQKFRAVMLPVSAAFHSPLVGHAQALFKDALQKVSFKAPQIPVFSNSTSKAYPKTAKSIKKLFTEHMLSSVLFKQEVENLAEAGATVFVEFGPRNVLTQLVSDILADKPHIAIALNARPKKCSHGLYRDALLQLCVAGLPLSLKEPYAKARDQTQAKASLVQIALSGANYVSPQTSQAFEEALKKLPQISRNIASETSSKRTAPASFSKPVPPSVSVSVPSQPSASIPTKMTSKPSPVVPAQTPSAPVQSHPAANALQENLNLALGQFYQHQTQTLKVQEQYLNHQQEYSRAFLALMQSQDSTYGQNQMAIPVPVEQRMQQFQEHQSETLKIHNSYLQQQSAFSQSTFQLIQNQYAMLSSNGVSTAPAFVPPVAPSLPAPVISAPVVTQPVPVISAPVVTQAPVISAPAPVVVPSIPAPAPVAVAPASVSASTKSLQALNQVLVDIVSEKTGFPPDMLKMSMDMEADLGIDSIKRVEILADMENQIPDLPELKPEDLAELRTLQEIVDHVQTKVPAASVTSASSVQTPVSASSTGSSLASLNQVLMGIVSEKTGFPPDMLKMGMDMEADLGIDSIKRVEILADMENQIPDLPELKPEDLAELRTLQEIVDHVQSKLSPASSTVEVTQVSVSNGGTTLSSLNQVLMGIVSEKTGFPADMLKMGMDMEADLGIDSIKRVEILADMENQVPDLPELKPEDLAELRTLQEIVDHVHSKVGGGSTSETPANSGSELEELNRVLLSVVSEKTGFPANMLKMEMDMEADLGIDSIKRVEILADIENQLPNLPELKPEDLAELRTLQEIADHVTSLTGSSATVSEEKKSLKNG